MTMPVLLALLLWVQEDPAKLIESIRSDSIKVREEAAKKLADLGRTALPYLEKAAKDPDLELASRAARIRRLIELRERLSPALLKKYPGIEERIEDDPHAATQVFLDLPYLPDSDRGEDSEGEAPDPLPRSDLQVLAAAAVRGARGEEVSDVCFKIKERGLVEAAPALVPFLTSADDQLRGMAAGYLADFRHRAAIPQIFKLLEDPWGNNRPIAEDALLALEAREIIPGLREQLKSKDVDVQDRAASMLGSFGDRASIPALLSLCRESRSTAWGALHALVEMKVPEADRFLVIPAREGTEGERGSALYLLVKLQSRQAIPLLRPLLKDPSPSGLVWPIQSLGEVGDPACIEDIKPFLDHPSPAVSGSAMFALAGMSWKEHLPMILRGLKEGDSNRRWFSVRALGMLRSPEHLAEILPLLGDRDVELRWAAMESLGRIGAKEALPGLRKALESRLKGDRDRALQAIQAIEGRSTASPPESKPR